MEYIPKVDIEEAFTLWHIVAANASAILDCLWAIRSMIIRVKFNYTLLATLSIVSSTGAI